ncbi:copper transporter [Isoptericola hypogeus]|uniref:Copper transporter n=1 Tax=Isoptericola hypogeus TaxID=300179 RepID=A0ABN2JWM8_9MICO
MIDFRYHLVSLISVFLALAVGVILGAGPLQGAIGDQLTDQVATLRDERNTLREELDEAQTEAGEQREFVEAAGQQLVSGSLAGQRVAVVDVDEVSDSTEQGVLDQLEEAGARVVAHESLTAAWTSADDATLRDTVAGGLRDRLDDLEGDDAEGDVITEESTTPELLGAALTVALTDADPTDPSARSAEAETLQGLLEQFGLVDVETAPEAPADAILLLSGGDKGADDAETQDADPATTGIGALTTLAGTAAELAPAVVAGPTTQEGDLVSSVRADDELVDTVTTVSGIEQVTGQIVVPLAVAAQQSGTVDQYGFEEGATVLPPEAGAPGGSDAASGTGEGQGK